MNIPTKFTKRIQTNLKKYQDIVLNLKKNDANEADTVRVIAGMLECIFGYNRFTEVTSEYAIGGTFCDLAIIDDRKKIKFLIEAKAISVGLKENHIKQTVDYGANAGVNWVILTNAEKWMVYKIKFGKPIDKELVYEFNFMTMTYKSSKDIELLYVLSKEGGGKSGIDEFYSSMQAKSKYIIGNLLNSDEIYAHIRKNLKILYENIKITDEEIGEVITNEILKREIVDSDESKKARRDIDKVLKKHSIEKAEKLELARKAAMKKKKAAERKALKMQAKKEENIEKTEKKTKATESIAMDNETKEDNKLEE